MKFMIIRKADANTEAEVMPSQELLEAMGRYNEQMIKDGVFVDGTGLKPSRYGARIDFRDGQPAVTDGPFAETKGLLAGFYMLEAKDLDEAIALAGKIPPARYGSVEVRPARELMEKGNQAGGNAG